MMNAVEIISMKRDRQTLTPAAIQQFVQAATHGHWPDYQLSSLLMAIFLNGMQPEEIAHLTRSMTDSGKRFRWDQVPGPKLDKHSTGGVGDKTSLILAPIVAACGGVVPMMSGRGLGHSGGTLDKLEAIPGFRVRLTESEILHCLQTTRMALFGQTDDVAPADRKLYALRDVTGTVESMPLITASILSKKLAEGIDALVLDVKCGFGAFMTDLPRAQGLAEALVRVGTANGLKMKALLTAMDQPLGDSVGNSNEIKECLLVLQGKGPADTTELSLRLAGEMLLQGGLAENWQDAQQKMATVIQSGKAMECLQKTIELQGGDPRIVEDGTLLPGTTTYKAVCAKRSGYITELNAKKIGLGAVRLGAGRLKAEDKIDPAVGIHLQHKLGATVNTGDAILVIQYRDEDKLAAAMEWFEDAIRISDAPITQKPLVLQEFV